MQVWTLKGEMIFEKPLEKPVTNWNISGNVLLFLEEVDSTNVWMVKLFEDKSPILFKFVIPSINHSKAVNSVYDVATQNYIIPTEGRQVAGLF